MILGACCAAQVATTGSHVSFELWRDDGAPPDAGAAAYRVRGTLLAGNMSQQAANVPYTPPDAPRISAATRILVFPPALD